MCRFCQLCSLRIASRRRIYQIGVFRVPRMNRQSTLFPRKFQTLCELSPSLVVPPAPAISVFTEMKPKDSVEAMIITQMISVHEMALLSSERALITEQPDEFVGKNINSATKLCRTYASLVEALNKHRTKGQQKITVQHVNVENGGQAIVGDVTQGEGDG